MGRKPVLVNTSPDMKQLDRIKADCIRLVRKRAWMSAGAAVVPVPFVDIAIDIGLLLSLLPQINKNFQLSQNSTRIFDAKTGQLNWQHIGQLSFEAAEFMMKRTIVRKTVQGFGARIVTKQVSKFIPLGGQLLAASIGYLTMRQIAMLHVEECYQQATAAKQAAA